MKKHIKVPSCFK